MKTDLGLERCLTFINCEIQPPTLRHSKQGKYTAITISRQAGAGGHAVAEELRELLQERAKGPGCPWTVFDRNLVERVLEEHNLPSRLARFMPEDRVSEVADTMDELFGLHPPSWSLVRSSSETILKLIERGNVIIIGRGANVIAAKVPTALHVRLVGSVERRAEYIAESRQMTARAALQALRNEDRARARYLKKYFDKDADDPLLYHLVLNTDLIHHKDAAKLIVETAMCPARVNDK